VVSSTPRPHFTPGKDPVHFVQEAGGPQGRPGLAENLVPTTTTTTTTTAATTAATTTTNIIIIQNNSSSQGSYRSTWSRRLEFARKMLNVSN